MRVRHNADTPRLKIGRFFVSSGIWCVHFGRWTGPEFAPFICIKLLCVSYSQVSILLSYLYLHW